MKSFEVSTGASAVNQVRLAPCPFCACAMHIETSTAGHTLAGTHDEKCPLHIDRVERTPVNDLWLPQIIGFWNRRFKNN